MARRQSIAAAAAWPRQGGHRWPAPRPSAPGLAAASRSLPAARSRTPPAALAHPPSILLVTLDTTRADSIAPESSAVETPALAALAARGRRFTRAYATVPTTLPSHASMLSGLYPAGHGVHENARPLAASIPLAQEQLRARGYATAAFVSSFILDRQFGLARGFDHYDDEMPAGADERSAAATTDRAVAYLRSAAPRPLFLWVHYYDPHHPYRPPEPFAARHRDRPYLGEIESMDRELGRLVAAFEGRAGAAEHRIVVAGDHGEGLGDHGEALHGNLLYEGVMRVPLLVAGAGIAPGVVDQPVSTRRIHHTLLAWAGAGDAGGSLASPEPEIVLGEAMKPYLDYGWQPQVMGLRGRIKMIRSGATEIYDVVADPGEHHDLAAATPPDRELARALAGYPLPAANAGPPELSSEEARRLASLGYAASPARPALRPGAPNPKDMAHLFADLDRASGLFAAERYDEAIAVFERVLEQDPRSFAVALQLAVAHSVLGHETRAREYFRRAERIEPDSVDLKHYRAMHHLRAGEWDLAAPLLEAVLARSPQRLAALEGLARIRERQGDEPEARALLERIVALKRAPEAELLKLGELAMRAGDTPAALRAFERARALQGDRFAHFLELGVLYLADRRYPEAAEALERVPAGHPGHPMALFKRAQVSVLLNEADRGERVRRARAAADATTRPLIEREALFKNM